MKIDITHSERSLSTSSVGKTDREAKISTLKRPLHDVVTINDSVRDTAAAMALARLGGNTINGAEPDRVRQVKEAIQQGNYPVDIDRLAQAILTKELFE